MDSRRSPTPRADSNGDVDGLFVARQQADGSWRADERLTTGGRPDDWPSLALDSAGGEHVAFTELDTGPNPGVYVRDPRKFDLAGRFDRGQRRLDDRGRRRPMSSRSSTSRGPPTAGSAPGSATNGTWAFETAATDPSAPERRRRRRLACPHLRGGFGALERHRRLAGVDDRTRRPRRPLESRRERSHVARLHRHPGSPSIASDETGGWQTASGYFGEDGQGAVTEDAEGRIHWVIAGDTLTYQTAPALDGPWTEKRLGTHAIDPIHRRRRRGRGPHRLATHDLGRRHLLHDRCERIVGHDPTDADLRGRRRRPRPGRDGPRLRRGGPGVLGGQPGPLPRLEPDRRLGDDQGRRGVRRPGSAARRRRHGPGHRSSSAEPAQASAPSTRPTSRRRPSTAARRGSTRSTSRTRAASRADSAGRWTSVASDLVEPADGAARPRDGRHALTSADGCAA